MVTFDALHSVKGQACWLVREKKAHHIAVIKANRSTALAQIKALLWEQAPVAHTVSEAGHYRRESRLLKTMAIAANLTGVASPKHGRPRVSTGAVGRAANTGSGGPSTSSPASTPISFGSTRALRVVIETPVSRRSAVLGPPVFLSECETVIIEDSTGRQCAVRMPLLEFSARQTLAYGALRSQSPVFVPLARRTVLNSPDIYVQAHKLAAKAFRHLTGERISSVEQALRFVHVHFCVVNIDSPRATHQDYCPRLSCGGEGCTGWFSKRWSYIDWR
ncbi:hypothetical protein ACR6C2_17180 [Streptomyces sp. INA 01156]